MSIARDKAIKIFKDLQSSPRKWMDLLGQFEAMSKGSQGPWLAGGYPRIRIREYYYPDWDDGDFAWVLSHVTGSGS